MRHYTTDSPEASARILALALLADGAIDLSELRTLQSHDIAKRVGLDDFHFDKVIQEFCEDVFSVAESTKSGHLELSPEAIEQLLGDIHDPLLQEKVLRSMLDIVNADGRLAGSEAIIVSKAMQRWDLDLLRTVHTPIPQVRRVARL